MVGEVNVLPDEANNRKLPDIDLSKSELTTEQVGQAQELISELRDVFSKDRRDYGRTSLLTHSINTGGAAPIKKTPYRLPQLYLQAAEQHVKEMAADGLIEPSISPWRAPIAMARKKRRFVEVLHRFSRSELCDCYGCRSFAPGGRCNRSVVGVHVFQLFGLFFRVLASRNRPTG